MALQQSYTQHVDIPEPLQEHYAEKDGRWLLVTDPPTEDVTGLKNALGQERNLRRDAEKQLVDLKTRFEGMDPDEYHKLQDRVKGLDDAEIYDKQGIEALVLRRTESMKADHDRQLQVKEREIGQLKSAVESTDRKWRQDRIKTALLAAVSDSGVDKYAVQDAVHRGMDVFVDLDEEGNVVAKDSTGVRYGKDGINPLTPNEWIQTLKASGEASHLWPPSSGSGAPAHRAGGHGAQIDWNSITNPAERLTRYREWQATQQR
jgi:hypothetical protein